MSQPFINQGFHNQNYLEIKKKYLISIFLAPMFQISQLETFKLPEVLVFYYNVYLYAPIDGGPVTTRQ